MKHQWITMVAMMVAAVMVSSCASSTRMTSSWMDNQSVTSPMRSVTILPVMHDPAFNLFFEKGLIKRLEENGVAAYSSSVQVTPQEDRTLDPDVIDSLTRESRSDWVLVTRFVSATQQEVYVPAFRSLYTNDINGYPIRRDPIGTTSVNTYYYYKTSLYSTSSGQLVWAGMTRTWNPDTHEQVMDEVIQILLEELKREGFLPQKPL